MRARWAEMLAAIDAVVGGLLVVAGAYLIEPTLVDLGFYIEGGRYALAGWFLVYSGLVLANAAVFGLQLFRSGILRVLDVVLLGSGALVATAIIHLVLAAQALLAEPPLYWVALLAVPGVLALVSSSFADIAKARAESAAQVTGPETTAESGKTDPRAIVREHVWAGLIGAVGNVVFIAFLGTGFLLYYLLEASLIEGERIDLGYVVEVVVPRFVEELWLLALLLGGLMLVVMPLIGWANAAQHRRARRRRPDIDRDLTPAEISFVTESVAGIGAYIEAQGLRRLARRLGWTFAASALVFFGGALWLALEAEAVVAWAYAPDGDAWHFYVADGPLLVVGVLLGIGAWSFMPTAMMALLSRRHAEANGVSALAAVGGLHGVETQVVKQVRRGALSPAAPVDASAFLRSFGIGGPLATLAWVLPLSAALAFAWPHDRALDTSFTEEAIETGDFWTAARVVHPYEAVETIELKCRFDDDEDTHIGYAIVLPEKRRRQLVNERRLQARLDDLLKVDEKLRAAGVPAVFALPEEAPAQADLLDRMCVIEITQDMSTVDREKVEQLFHLDEWHERRWRWRTRTPQISTR